MHITQEEAFLTVQSLFMKKSIKKGNAIPISENLERSILVFGENSSGELIFKVDNFRNVYFRNNYEWQLITN